MNHSHIIILVVTSIIIIIAFGTNIQSVNGASCTNCGLRSYLTDLQQEYDKLSSTTIKLSKAIDVLVAANSSLLSTQIQTRRKQLQKVQDAQSLLSIELFYISDRCSKARGDNCDQSCFGILEFSSFVCSGHGSCISQDVCQCNQNYTGLNCSVPMCDSIPATNSSVCNGKGQCIANNTCQCTVSGVGGTFCSAASIIGDDAGGRKYSDLSYARSCKEYLKPSNSIAYSYSGSVGSGFYWIKPDVNIAAFKVYCEMSVDGGKGLTSINIDVEASSLNTAASTSRVYYYVQSPNVWYKSPSSTVVWHWASYAALSGTYYYTTNNGVTMNNFACTSAENVSSGVGCSNGANASYKVVMYGRDTPTGYTGTVCQNQPNIFGSGSNVCIAGIAIYMYEL